MTDVEFTRRRVEVLVQAVIAEYRYPLALRSVEECGVGFAVKRHLEAILAGSSASE